MLRCQFGTLPFVKGLDRGGNDPKMSTGLTVAENVVVTRKGALDKRCGKTAMSGSYSHKHLGSHNGRPVLFDENGIAIANGSTVGESSSFDTVETYFGQARMSSETWAATQDDQGVSASVKLMETPELAISDANNLIILAWQRDSRIEVRTFNRHTKKQLNSAWLNCDDNSNPRIIVGSTHAYLWYCDGSFNVKCVPILLSDGDILTGSAADFTGTHSWPEQDEDVPIDAVLTNTDQIHVVYKERGTDDMVIGVCAWSGATNISRSVTQVTKTDLEYVTCTKWADDNVLIVYHQESAPNRDIRACIYDASAGPSLLTNSDASLYTWTTEYMGQAAVLRLSGNDAYVYWTKRNASGDDTYDGMLYRNKYTYDSGGPSSSVGSELVIAGHVSIWTKPFQDSNSRIFIGLHACYSGGYALAGWDPSAITDSQRLYVMFEDKSAILAGQPVGRWLIGTGDQIDFRRAAKTYLSFVTTPVVDGTDEWLAAGLEIGGDLYESNLVGKHILHAIKMESNVTQCDDYETRNEMVLPGSCACVFDGRQVFEQGFIMAPPKPEVTPTGSGGGWTPSATGDFYYAAMFELVDVNGNVWRSPLSVISTATVTGATDSVTVKVRHCGLTWVPHSTDYSTRIVIFRSDEPGSTVLVRWCTLVNVVTTATTSVSDTGYDLTGNAQEYTQFGTVPGDEQPPPYEVSTVWQNRIFVVHSRWPDRLIRYSKEMVEGYGHGFPTSFTIEPTPEYGNIVALESMDDKLLIFKRRAVMATTGQGRTNANDADGYFPPFYIAEGMGCKTRRSVVSTPVGVLFESDESICMVKRNATIEPVGRVVKQITDGTTINAAVLDAPRDHVLFFLADGTTLVYNYLFNVWTLWTNFAADDAVEIDGEIYFKEQGSNSVWRRDTSTYLDDLNTWIRMRVRTAWVSLAGLFRSKRLWETFLAAYALGNHLLHIRIAYDGDAVWTDELTFDAATLQKYDFTQWFADSFESAATHDDQAYTLRWRGSRTRVESSVMIEIEDEGPIERPDGPSLSLIGLGFKYGVDQQRGSRIGSTRWPTGE